MSVHRNSAARFFSPFFLFSCAHYNIYIYTSIAYLITKTIANLKFVRRLILKLILTVSKFRQKKKKKQNKQRIRREEKYRITANIYFVSIFHISGCLKKCGNLINYRGMLDRRREPLSLSLSISRERGPIDESYFNRI